MVSIIIINLPVARFPICKLSPGMFDSRFLVELCPRRSPLEMSSPAAATCNRDPLAKDPGKCLEAKVFMFWRLESYL